MYQEKLLTLLQSNKWQIIFALLGLLLIGGGILSSQIISNQESKVEIINPTQNTSEELIVEISGSVKNPGVYKMAVGSRIDDLITKAGGTTHTASEEFLSKIINRAAKITDGQKVYIPSNDEQSVVLSANDSSGGSTISNNNSQQLAKTININTASASLLESMSGIGPVTAQKIIENRPYSTLDELVSKKVIGQKVFDTNKNIMTVY